MNNNTNVMENESLGIIYKITNEKNNKVYIGQTIRSLKERIAEHKRNHTAISEAIRKYGIDSFKIEVIDKGNDTEELNTKEIKWIAYYNSISPLGYNLCNGGGNTTGYRHTESNKKIMNAKKEVIFLGSNNPFYGKTHSAEQRLKWSKERKGRDMSEVTKASLKVTRRKVINIDTGEVFNSINEASNIYNLKPTHISRVCRGKRKRTGGYKWMYYEDYLERKNTIMEQLTLFV